MSIPFHSFQCENQISNLKFVYRDEDRDKGSDHLKSSSSEESVRKRRPSGTISVKSQLSVFSQNSMPAESESTPSSNQKPPHHHQQQQPQQQMHSANSLNDKTENNSSTTPTTNNIPIPNKQLIESDFHYEVVDNVKNKYNYHDEPHSFENSMEFLEDYNHFQFEVLETTV